ncbi:AAA family ATPase [Leptolyngbya sp. AN03gr2]|uniref:AAA family ATPase n=1 Tax=unclassified Leptolyngbya TaxID=2650499 RepID=UPI003D31CEED
MLKSLKIENFRGFKSFELQQLGRINLFVGLNNSGKTSILEAIQLLCAGTNLDPLVEIMINRGEYDDKADLRQRQFSLDIHNIFYNHNTNLGNSLTLSGLYDGVDEKITMSLHEYDNSIDNQPGLFNDGRLVLAIEQIDKRQGEEREAENRRFPLSFDLKLHTDDILHLRRDSKIVSVNSQFITPLSLSTDKMIEMFEDNIVLTPEEEVINKALHSIDPKIERIAPQSSRKNDYSRSGSRAGFLVKLSGINQRVPIGSMGDGIWRMLGLALSIVSAKKGILLVDEIDAGLHFTTMIDMWRMLLMTARRLNVQVFATTHSRDCWESLAEVARLENCDEDEMMIHRIERGRNRSVIFSGRKLVVAAEQEIEVR